MRRPREWGGGERYKPADVYYHELRGVVTGTTPGDSVEVWFEGGGARSDSFTYGPSPRRRPRAGGRGRGLHGGVARAAAGARTTSATTSTRWRPTASPLDVYDVDARGRTAPDHLGVLSHYDAVIWYTGDDIVTRRVGLGRRATRAGWRWTRCSSSAPT